MNSHRLQVGDGPAPDFIIAVEDKQWPVHKLVLFCHSDVLYKMSTNAAFIECQTRRVLLKDVEPRCVEAMVQFLYHQTYPGYLPANSINLPVLPSAAEDESFVGLNTMHDHVEEDGEMAGPDGSDHGESIPDLSDGSAERRMRPLSGSDAGWASPMSKSSVAGSRARAPIPEWEYDRLDFHLGVCILAECYNMKALKLAAETYIEGFLAINYSCNYEKLSSVVDKILDSDAPESMRRKVVEALVHQTEFLHMDPKLTESESLLDRRPELAVAVLKNIAKKRHIRHLRQLEITRRNRQYSYNGCWDDKDGAFGHTSHPLCVDREWPEGDINSGNGVGW